MQEQGYSNISAIGAAPKQVQQWSKQKVLQLSFRPSGSLYSLSKIIPEACLGVCRIVRPPPLSLGLFLSLLTNLKLKIRVMIEPRGTRERSCSKMLATARSTLGAS